MDTLLKVALIAGAAFVGVKVLSKKGVVSKTPTQTAAPIPNAGQGIGGAFAGIANNLTGSGSLFAKLFDSTGSGANAPRNIGSAASGLYPSPLLFNSPSLGDYSLADPYNTPPPGFYDTPSADDFQLQNTGIWASSSSFGGSTAPNYNGPSTVFGDGFAADFQLQ